MGEAQGAYPDVEVSEDLFVRLPLWTSAVEVPLRRWVFHLLACFADDTSAPRLPPSPESSSSPRQTGVIARRLFAYLAIGSTPSEGLGGMLELLLPAAETAGAGEGEADAEPQVFVKDIWAITFATSGRASKAVVTPRDLEPFCRELVPPPPPPEAPPAKKGQPPPTPPEPVPPPPPEEVKTTADVSALMRHPAMIRALCTHGSLHCRKRALEALFVSGTRYGSAAQNPQPPICASANTVGVEVLTSLVPPPPEQPGAAEG